MGNSAIVVDANDYQKIKQELQEARNEINRMNQEMHSQQVARATMDHLTQSSESDYSYAGDVTEQTLTQLQNKFNATTRASFEWDTDTSRPTYCTNNSLGQSHQVRAPHTQAGYRRNGFLNEPTHFPLDQSFRSSGSMSGSLSAGLSNNFSGVNHVMSNPPSRPGSAFDPLYNQYTAPQSYGGAHTASMGAIGNSIGAPGSKLSPDASEFSAATLLGPSPWNSQVSNFVMLKKSLF